MRVFPLFLFAAALTLPAGGQEKPPRSDRADESRPDEEPVAFANPELQRLELFAGAWKVAETHFNPRGEVVGKSKGTEEIAWVLDHHALRRVYTTSGGSTTFRATGMLTWNDAEKKYQGAWFDNVSTSGPTTVKGVWDDPARTMLFELESVGPGGSALHHRVVEKFESLEQRTATTYLVEGSSLVKRIETVYTRTTPCPSGVRAIFDE